ncbi:MAG TPA: hypothetical protein VMU32_00680 [Solirubrobacteraceae bacterium]|nr:hypothetical protein [Solirubrobacteraceae bacterium]
MTGRLVKAIVPVAVFAVALAVSVAGGHPGRLPGIAMGSVVLLHIERAAAALGALGAVWLIGWRALHGDFPIKFGNVEYAEEVEASSEAVDALRERVKLLEDVVLADMPDDDLDSEGR